MQHRKHGQYQATDERRQKKLWRIFTGSGPGSDQDPTFTTVQDSRYFLNHAMVAGHAARVAAMFAPSIPVCCLKKMWPAPG